VGIYSTAGLTPTQLDMIVPASSDEAAILSAIKIAMRDIDPDIDPAIRSKFPAFAAYKRVQFSGKMTAQTCRCLERISDLLMVRP
jgi:hypothetical protein